MAQSTAGIKLYYGDSADGTTIPASWTEIPDITSTPAMGSAPAQLDTTDLSALVMKTYISGLQDLGNLEFGANMTPELIAAVDLAAAAVATGHARAFKLSFPAPLSVGYWWTGTVEPVRPGEASVDAVTTTTLYITVATEIEDVDESGVS